MEAANAKPCVLTALFIPGFHGSGLFLDLEDKILSKYYRPCIHWTTTIDRLFLDDCAYEYSYGNCKGCDCESFVMKVCNLKPNSNFHILVV
jgi:hypothetical protein